MPTPDRRSALVTGASSGIGAEFARQLAAMGYNLILTARRADRLVQIADELKTMHGIEAEVLPADLSQPDGQGLVEAFVKNQDRLDLLVNNAGFGARGAFACSDVRVQQAMLEVHMMAPMRLCRAALPAMVARQSGVVINVASLAGFASLPGNANYCATKAYLIAFSQSVASEVRSHGVVVQALCPGFTVTEMHSRTDIPQADSFAVPSFLKGAAAVVVAASLRDAARGRELCVPGALNRVIYLLLRAGMGRCLGTAPRPSAVTRALLTRGRMPVECPNGLAPGGLPSDSLQDPD